MGYVITLAGTFGTVSRTYNNMQGRLCAVVTWGPLGWHTPVFYDDVIELHSAYESTARAEAMDQYARIHREHSTMQIQDASGVVHIMSYEHQHVLRCHGRLVDRGGRYALKWGVDDSPTCLYCISNLQDRTREVPMCR